MPDLGNMLAWADNPCFILGTLLALACLYSLYRKARKDTGDQS